MLVVTVRGRVVVVRVCDVWCAVCEVLVWWRCERCRSLEWRGVADEAHCRHWQLLQRSDVQQRRSGASYMLYWMDGWSLVRLPLLLLQRLSAAWSTASALRRRY